MCAITDFCNIAQTVKLQISANVKLAALDYFVNYLYRFRQRCIK